MIDEPSQVYHPLSYKNSSQCFQNSLTSSTSPSSWSSRTRASALSIAHRAYVLQTGRIVASGSAMSLQDDESVRRSYLGY